MLNLGTNGVSNQDTITSLNAIKRLMFGLEALRRSALPVAAIRRALAAMEMIKKMKKNASK